MFGIRKITEFLTLPKVRQGYIYFFSQHIYHFTDNNPRRGAFRLIITIIVYRDVPCTIYEYNRFFFYYFINVEHT